VSVLVLQDKVAIVTGGTRGIGRAIVLAFARQGADCVFTFASNATAADALAGDVSALGRRAMPVRLDVRDFEGAVALIENVKKEFGRVDLLVNNAGITRDKSLMMMTRDDWSEVIDVNLTGVFTMTRACIITFLKQKSGAIINISSAGGIRPLPGQTNYAAAKAGVIGFTKALAREAAPYNVRVNAVAPGFIETEMTGSFSEKQRDQAKQLIPLGRFGTTEDVAQAAVFLAGDDARYITGQVLIVDGGLAM
jgi:3-oxoacyl-[acyl-carrier protein] reductase